MPIQIPKNLEVPSRTAWWVLGELNSRRKAAKQREHDLIKTRKKLENDLNDYGSQKSAGRTRCAELYVDTCRAIEATRDEIKWLADQVENAMDHAAQPRFWEDTEVVERMLGEQPKVEPIDELIAAANDVSASGEGPVGGDEPAIEGEGDDAPPPPLAAEGQGPAGRRSAKTPVVMVPDSLRTGQACQVLRRRDGELVAQGEFEAFMPKAGAATVRVKGSIRRFELEEQGLIIVHAPRGTAVEEGAAGVAGMIRDGEIVGGKAPAAAPEPAPAEAAPKKRGRKSAS